MTHEHVRATRLPLGRVGVILYLSGFCSLIYQSVWLREFRFIFGASTMASSAVLAIFMGGLGVGGWVIGKRAGTWRKPFEAYAKIELAITLATAVTPLLLDATMWLYLASGGSSTMGPVLNTIVRLLLSTLVIGPSVFFMGGTLPAAAQAVTAAQDTSRRALAILYGVNTLGAVTGVMAGTFVLFEIYGFRTTLWMACILNALLAVVARATSRQREEEVDIDAVAKEVGQAAEIDASDLLPRPLVLGAAFTTGFVFLLAELVWYRMTGPLLGGSTYTLGVVLAMALLGIAIGGLLHDASGARARPLPERFAITCALMAALLMAPMAMGDELAIFTYHVAAFSKTSFLLRLVGWSLVTAIIVLPASIVAGYQFPLLFALKGRGSEEVGSDVGEIYAANTLGAVLGSLAGGFGLMPALGALGAWRLTAAMLIVLSIGLVFARARRARSTVATVLALTTIALGGLFAQGPTDVWRHSAIGAGRANLSFNDQNDKTSSLRSTRGFVFKEYEGVESVVGVTGADGMSMLTNGKSDGNTYIDAVTQIFSVLLPAILHEQGPKRAFVIGLGTGQSSGWLAEVPTMEMVETVEIEPNVLDFARLIKTTNHDAADHPKAIHHIGDGREVLITSPYNYDLIVSEPSNPYRAGIAGFYTEEFYTLAETKLAPGGYFVQWLQGYEVGPEVLAIALKTMRSVFTHVTIWSLSPGDLLLLASNHDQRVDPALVGQRLALEPWRTATLKLLGSDDPRAILARHIATDEFTQALAARTPRINRDDMPLMEYEFATSVGRSHGSSLDVQVRSMARVRQFHLPRLVDAAASPDPAILDGLHYRNALASAIEKNTLPSPIHPENAPLNAFWNAYNKNELLQAYELFPVVRPLLQDDALFALVETELTLYTGLPGTLDTMPARFEALEARGWAAEVTWLEFVYAVEQRRWADVGPAAARAFQTSREVAFTRRAIIKHVFTWLANQEGLPPQATRGVLEALLEGPLAAHNLELSRLQLGFALVKKPGGGELCAEFFDQLGERVPWEDEVLATRVACYEERRSPHLDLARRELATFRAARSDSMVDILSRPVE